VVESLKIKHQVLRDLEALFEEKSEAMTCE